MRANVSGRINVVSAGSYIPALRIRALTRFYDPVVALTTREREFKQRLIDQLGPAPGQRILDLGCGTGTLALLVKERQPEAAVAGLDADPEMLWRAGEKAAAAGVEVELSEGRSDAMPYGDGSFDAVVSTLFFHHLSRPVRDATAAEIVRVLAPGSELHVADWGKPADPLMGLAGLAIRMLDGFEPTADNFAGRLPAIFAAAGLTEVRTRDRMRTAFGTLAFHSARKAENP
jgi:ubiquinone/menaquinone biosynthesis C-methylase UbiE